jgi:hypothetical protein
MLRCASLPHLADFTWLDRLASQPGHAKVMDQAGARPVEAFAS